MIVVGGGAAGLACAVEAGRRGRRVLVLERNAELGRKILISGGGRCNFPGLHFVGEAVDVTGWLGGYNFQWAWASGLRPGGWCSYDGSRSARRTAASMWRSAGLAA